MHAVRKMVLAVIVLLMLGMVTSYGQERSVAGMATDSVAQMSVDHFERLKLQQNQNVDSHGQAVRGLSTVRRRDYQPVRIAKPQKPGIYVDSSRVSAIKNSWLNRDYEFQTDGRTSSGPSFDKNSLSGLKNAASLKNNPADFVSSTKGELDYRSLLNKGLGSLSNPLEDAELPSIFSVPKQDLSTAKTIYSEKVLQQLYDSMGVDKFNELYKAASSASKKNVNEQEFLEAVNKAAAGKVPNHDEHRRLSELNEDQLMELPKEEISSLDLSTFQLPSDLASGLPPLTGQQIPTKYLNLVDSLRDINLRKDGLVLKEDAITEKLKSSMAGKVSGFWDRSYFEGILGYFHERELTLLQISPAFAYHLTKAFSIGAGPSVLVRINEKNVNASLGFRTFAKVEFYQRRLYVQLEDSMNPRPIDTEVIRRSNHSILFGGGGLLPIGGKVAINPSLLYRINNNATGDQSPWVFRLGISSIKSK